jgi:mono/diheme cytochrome c family protein
MNTAVARQARCTAAHRRWSVSFVITSLIAVVAMFTSAAQLPRGAQAQQPVPARPQLVINSMVGRDLFEFYCASCHGRDGKGHGYAAAALKKAPPDLTALSRRNHGTFPAERVKRLIEGTERLSTPAHGSSDMPLWGPIFKGLDTREAINEDRIENVVKYIESLQEEARAAP